MAYSVQKTKWSQNNPTERINTNEQAGRVRIAYATYEASAEQSTSEMFNLPDGARLLRGYLGHDALGSGTTSATVSTKLFINLFPSDEIRKSFQLITILFNLFASILPSS